MSLTFRNIQIDAKKKIYDFYKKNKNFQKLCKNHINIFKIEDFLYYFKEDEEDLIKKCKKPYYLCCNDDDPEDYTCDPCEDCCTDNNAVSSTGKSINCPKYCKCKNTK